MLAEIKRTRVPPPPDRDRPAWECAFDADIVGEPQRIRDDLLVVADLSGHFAGFDPATGQKTGPGYTLRANVAPAAAPVLWHARVLFAPLTDGTVLMLPLARLGPAHEGKGSP